MASLYEQLGGEPAVNAAVDLFYRKVLADDRINGFFKDIDMERQIAKQRAFMTMAFGGPSRYSGMDLRRGHAHLREKGLNYSHFDAVVGHLRSTLNELKVPAPLTQQVLDIVEGGRGDVLNR